MLYQYIIDKGYKTYVVGSPQYFDINRTALNLGFTIEGNPLLRKEADKATINMQLSKGLLKHLSLSYYANQISVYFKEETILHHSIGILTEKRKMKNVTRDQIFELSQTIRCILENEFLNKDEDLSDR
jgi:hypothetical protein